MNYYKFVIYSYRSKACLGRMEHSTPSSLQHWSWDNQYLFHVAKNTILNVAGVLAPASKRSNWVGLGQYLLTRNKGP